MNKQTHALRLVFVLLAAAIFVSPMITVATAQETECKPGDPNCPKKPKPQDEGISEDDC